MSETSYRSQIVFKQIQENSKIVFRFSIRKIIALPAGLFWRLPCSLIPLMSADRALQSLLSDMISDDWMQQIDVTVPKIKAFFPDASIEASGID